MDLMADPPPRLARRLALPERAPDEAFVGRVRLALHAAELAREAAKSRREQLLIEIGGGGALLLAAHQFGRIGEQAATLLAPMATGSGGVVLAALASVAVLIALAGGREGLA